MSVLTEINKKQRDHWWSVWAKQHDCEGIEGEAYRLAFVAGWNAAVMYNDDNCCAKGGYHTPAGNRYRCPCCGAWFREDGEIISTGSCDPDDLRWKV